MTDPVSAEGLLNGNAREREHTEETNEGRRFWRCVPLMDAVQAAALRDVPADRAKLWEKFTAGEKLAYGCGYRDGLSTPRQETSEPRPKYPPHNVTDAYDDWRDTPLDETTHAILRRFWKVPHMEGSDGHWYVRRDSVSAAIQNLPDPALSNPRQERYDCGCVDSGIDAAAQDVVAAYLSNDDKGLRGACADLAAALYGPPIRYARNEGGLSTPRQTSDPRLPKLGEASD